MTNNFVKVSKAFCDILGTLLIAKKFMRDYLDITFSKTPDEDLLEKIFCDINNTDGVYRFLYRDTYFFITKLTNNS